MQYFKFGCDGVARETKDEVVGDDAWLSQQVTYTKMSLN